MKKFLTLTLVLFLSLFVVDQASAKLKICSEDQASGFTETTNWDNCYGFAQFENYFSELSKITKKEIPHDYELDLRYSGMFRNGLPHGKGYASLVLEKYNKYVEHVCKAIYCESYEEIDNLESEVFKKLKPILEEYLEIENYYIKLGKKSIKTKLLIMEIIKNLEGLENLKKQSYVDGKVDISRFDEESIGFYDGELKNGLPHGNGKLYHFGVQVTAKWKDGCIDWNWPTQYVSGEGAMFTKRKNKKFILSNTYSHEEEYNFDEVEAEDCSYWVDKVN